MAPRMLQINFNFNMPRKDLEQLFMAVANDFAAVPGLRWKIWSINEAQNEVAGFYLFDDQESIERMLASPLAAAVTSNAAFSNFSVKSLEVVENCTRVTRGPIDKARAAAD